MSRRYRTLLLTALAASATSTTLAAATAPAQAALHPAVIHALTSRHTDPKVRPDVRQSGIARTLGTAAILPRIGPAAAQVAVHSGGPDATPACGRNCLDLSSLVLGSDTIQNADIGKDNGTGSKAGQTLNLKTASNTSPDEDFTNAKVGDLADFCGNLISATSYACLNYPKTFPVYESNWSPFGNESGLCAGVKTADRNNEPVTLQNCGASARTLWVGDRHAKVTSHRMVYLPWVNASDRNFSHPLVLTVDQSSRHPGNQLRVERLDTLTGGVTPDTQEFTMQRGPAA